MLTALAVGVFGVAGALLRFAADSWFARHRGSLPHWPWATFAVNVAGSFIIGVAVGLTGHLAAETLWHAALTTGLAGGLTTFSSWTTATVRLVSETRYLAAALNIASNLLAGFAAAGLGLLLAG